MKARPVRLSFTRFLSLGFEDGISDGTTLWLFCEKLAKAGLVEKLFERFSRQLGAKEFIARGGHLKLILLSVVTGYGPVVADGA